MVIRVSNKRLLIKTEAGTGRANLSDLLRPFFMTQSSLDSHPDTGKQILFSSDLLFSSVEKEEVFLMLSVQMVKKPIANPIESNCLKIRNTPA